MDLVYMEITKLGVRHQLTTSAYLIVLLGFLVSCGGGSSDNTDVPVISPVPPVQSIAKITDANTGDLGTIILLLGEGVIETSELIESEVLWFYHAPPDIVVRDCPNGGKVSWELPSKSKLSNSGTFIYDDCLRIINSSPAIFTGAVNVSFNISPYPESLDLSQQKIINTLTILMETDELQVAEPNSSDFVPITFDMTSLIEQQFEDNTSEFPVSFLKTKDLQIEDFSFSFGDQRERVYQGVGSQYESLNANTNGFHYEYNLTAKYQSSVYDIVADLTGKVTSPDIPENSNYSQRDINGTFAIDVDSESLQTSFNNEFIDVSSSSGYAGQALTYQILEDTTFRLKNNYIMYSEIQIETPMKLVDFTPNNILKDSDQQIIFKFNKLLSQETRAYLRYPINWTLDTEFTTLNSNQLSVDIVAVRKLQNTFNLYNIDLIDIKFIAQAYKVQPTQNVTAGIGFIREGKGSLIALEEPVDYIDMSANGELIGVDRSSAENTLLYRFNAEGNILSQGASDIRLNNLCVDGANDNLFFTTSVTGATGGEYQRDILQFDSSFTLLQSWYLDDKTNFRVQCQNDFIFYYDIGPRAGALDSGYYGQHIFTFADNSLYDLGFDDSESGIYKAVNKITRNQTYSLFQSLYFKGDGRYQNAFEIIENDFNTLPAEKTVLPISQSVLDIDDFGYTDFPLRISDDNQLLFDNNVIDLNTLNVLHEFTQQDDDGTFEYIRYQNDIHNLIVTSRSVYDSQTYQKLFDLPYIDRTQTEENWFVDKESRLNILINGSWLYQSPSLR
jgi:hypothetical protein